MILIFRASPALQALAAARRRSELGAACAAVLLPFALTRVIFVLITLSSSWWAARFGITIASTMPRDNLFATDWFRWDAHWYMYVAQDGYSLHAYGRPGQIDVAYFPLYPLLVHLLLQIWPWSRYVAPMALANACSLGASWSLYRLVALEHGRDWALRATWLFALLPMSLFFFAGYAESLFLLCVIQCFYRLRLRQWRRAGLWGGLASATHSLGIMLMVPYALFWLEAYVPEWQTLSSRLYRGAWRHILSRYARSPFLIRRGVARVWRAISAGLAREEARAALRPMLRIPAGLALYMAYLWARFDRPLLFSTAEQAWNRGFTFPWIPLTTALTKLFKHLPHLTVPVLQANEDVFYALVGLVLSVLATRSLRLPYACFIWVFWAITLATGTTLRHFPAPLMSLPRYMLTAFPLVIFLAATPRRTIVTAAITLPLLLYSTTVFVAGQWLA